MKARLVIEVKKISRELEVFPLPLRERIKVRGGR